MLLLFDFFIISGSKVLVRWVVFRERRKCWMFKVCVSLVPPCAQRFLALFGINKKYLWPCEAHRNQSINQSKLYLPHHFIKNSRPVQMHLHTYIRTYINFILQGARKSLLQLAQTSFQLAPKMFWWAELISQFFCKLNSSKYFTYPSDKLRTEFTSPIAKSTRPGQLDTTFFARCFTTNLQNLHLHNKLLRENYP